MRECVRFLTEEEREGYDFVAKYIERGAVAGSVNEQFLRESEFIPKRFDDRTHALE